jgi:hypothetical protein
MVISGESRADKNILTLNSLITMSDNLQSTI